MLSSWKTIQLLTRFYPLYKGRGRLALSKYLQKKETELILTSLKTGQYIYIYPNDYIGKMVYFFGDLDPAITCFIKNEIRSGDIVIDIGANIGVTTLPEANIVGEKGKVFAFEPQKRIAEALRKSLSINKFNNVTIFNLALSDQDGSVPLYIPEGNYGLATVQIEKVNTVCEAKQLDSIYFDKKINNIRLMKIDVEGYEANVLKGALKFMKKYTPEIILFESHRCKDNFWNREEVKILFSLGYSFFEVNRSIFSTAHIKKVPQDLHYCSNQTNSSKRG